MVLHSILFFWQRVSKVHGFHEERLDMLGLFCNAHVGPRFSFGGWTHRERICVLQRIPETPMHYSARWNLHVRFMADSSRIHREFMPVSFSPKKSKSCQIHATFMAVSWRFHIQAWPGYSLPRSIEKMIQKVGFSCRFGFFWLISVSFLAMCQIHVGFMALSWHFHGAFFILIFVVFFLKKSKPTTESISKMTVYH